MKYEIALTGSGWLDIYLEENGREFFITAAYATDVLGDITSNLLSMIRMYITPPNSHPNPLRPPDYYLPSTDFPILNEPGSYKWSYAIRENDNLIITIQEYKDYEPGKYIDEVNEAFVATLSLWEFVRMHTIQLEQILKQYGITGFRKNWIEHEFPLSFYLLLKKVSDFSPQQLLQMGSLDNVRYPLLSHEVEKLFELCTARDNKS
ncbi:MAG: hypothetical protein HZB62_04700 [Nitrospirae bacterium]|nr:hypothetical protein [Nitrospirota bacterium]